MDIPVISVREHFRKRPGMYLGAAWMSRFEPWLCGVMLAERVHNIAEGCRVFPHLDKFEEFLSKKRGYSRNVRSFGFAKKKAKLLVKKPNSNAFDEDAEAYNIWMKLYDDFTKAMDCGKI